MEAPCRDLTFGTFEADEQFSQKRVQKTGSPPLLGLHSLRTCSSTRLAALGPRAVNAPFRSLCFVALFDQVVDCRLLACVSSVDLPWRCGGHSHSPRPVAAFSAFSSSQIRRLDWKGRPFHRGYRKRPRRLLNRLRPRRFLSDPRAALSGPLFRPGPPSLLSSMSRDKAFPLK